jgi:hypothetical protein
MGHAGVSEAGAEGAAGAVSVSVEWLFWAPLLAAAASLRLVGLERLELGVDEAERALDAALVSGGSVPETWTGDLAQALTSYLFSALGESEWVTRLAPALAGALLPVVLFAARPYLGRLAGLAAAAMLAFSPLFVLFSRSALPFSVGSLVAVVMALSLLGYLRNPRSWLIFPLSLSVVLAPLTDAVAVTALAALVVWLVVEAVLLDNPRLREAWQAFRSSPLQWGSALLIAAAAVQLGLTHFGTSLDRTGMPGLALWSQMFEMPRDSRAPEYHLALLAGYEAPLLLVGAAAFAGYVLSVGRRGLRSRAPSRRLALVWTAVAAATLALTTQREAGQLLALLLPLAVLAGCGIEDATTGLDWSVLRRWWPAAVGSLLLFCWAGLLMSQWAAGNSGPLERFLLVLTLGTAGFLVVFPVLVFRHNGLAAAAPVLAAAGLAFALHSSFAVAVSAGAEFATGARIAPRAQELRVTLERLAEERGGTVVIDRRLLPALGWVLRDSEVVFGGPVGGATLVLAPPNEGPERFVGLGDVWTLAEGWYPDGILRLRQMWRWFMYREAFGETGSVEARFYVPTIP